MPTRIYTGTFGLGSMLAFAAGCAAAIEQPPGAPAQRPSAVQLHEDRYGPVSNWPNLPKSMNDGRWGEVPGIDIAPDGSVWVFHRCFGREPFGSATCIGRDQFSPILHFDRSGNLLGHFGNGMLAYVHGSHVDREGNVWVTDVNEDATVLGLSTQGKGAQVFKFSPSGKLLMTLGKAGVRGNGTDVFDAPTDVATAPNGDIFVTDGHSAGDSNNRVMKFSRDGRFIKQWGRTGSKPGEFRMPHTIALDSQGRVFVGDRFNNRVQIFDQDGNFIAEWHQFGRPSGIAIAPDDTIYVSDSTSNSSVNPEVKRGVYVGNARTGAVTDFIPDPDPEDQEKLFISGATGIAASADGRVYLGDVGPARIRVYERMQ